VGDGRVSRHWRHYFTSLDIPWRLWSRRIARAEGGSPESALADCPVILLAVSDDAIEPVSAALRAAGLGDRSFVHFCGGRSFPNVFGAHPLMSFGATLYEPRFYRSIPVFAEATEADPDPVARFGALFPRLPNPCFSVAPADKAYYHALCALAGGMTAVLWRDFFTAMETRFGAPREALANYPRRIIENVLDAPDGALTGPVARGDDGTIRTHLDALGSTALGTVYRAFIAAAGVSRP
jgi:predicted short-subunit dehydrogenase-like oxidoreductase (DUF2520 family)